MTDDHVLIDQETRTILERLVAAPGSPAEIANDCGVTAKYVGRAVATLRQAGFTITQDENVLEITDTPGYPSCLARDVSAPVSLELHTVIASTNDRAAALGRNGAHDIVVIATRQTGGRGRRGRAWHSPDGGVWMSLLVRPTLAANRRTLLTFAAAVAVCESISKAGVTGRIKWPNDVIVGDEGRKIAGILTQSGHSSGGDPWVAVGVGLNADIDPTDLPSKATSIRAVTESVDRCFLGRNVITGFYSLMDRPEEIRRRWRSRTSTLGQQVRVETPNGPVLGTAEDIDETGALCVRTADGIQHVTVGDCEHLHPA